MLILSVQPQRLFTIPSDTDSLWVSSPLDTHVFTLLFCYLLLLRNAHYQWPLNSSCGCQIVNLDHVAQQARGELITRGTGRGSGGGGRIGGLDVGHNGVSGMVALFVTYFEVADGFGWTT